MRVHVVSDVHGSVDALARAGAGADVLVCLGDLVLFIDYADPSGGIFGSVFGPERAAQWVALRTERRWDEARALLRELWSQAGGDPWEVITEAVRGQYAALFAAMPDPTYLTYGNVDLPALWPQYIGPGHTVLDGQIATIGGRVFGFVGGGLPTPYRTPFEVPEQEYAAKVDAVFAAAAAAGTPLDVLCTHIPPALPELTYDVVARRFERGSEATLRAIREHQPPLALFGHVHQPLLPRMRVGRTECVNVGHFRGVEQPYVLTW
ncbi:MAG TPA: metallophosphoesterase [Sporichthyaceae bacterium]|jgi:Icc-related predicted phosphoesterase|nr:metallophosphoesterase [Sporichthyaceae bacterium]